VDLLIDAGIGSSEIRSAGTSYSSRCIGEHFTSVKQLLSRNCQLQPTTTQAYASSHYHIYPYFVTGYTSTPVTGALVIPRYAADAFSFFAPMYAYFRGSARVYLAGLNSGVGEYLSGMDPMFFKNISTTDYFLATPTTSSMGQNKLVVSGISTDKNAVNSMIPTRDGNVTSVFQQGTYQNQFPVSFVHVWQGEAIDYMGLETSPATSIVVTNPPGSSLGASTVFYRSFTDDFQLSFFIACPPLYYATAAV